MRRIIIALLSIFFVLLFASCYNYVFVPIGGNDNVQTGTTETISNVGDLRTFLSKPGSDKAYLNVRINVDEESLPIQVNGIKEISGNISIESETSGSTGDISTILSNTSPNTISAVFEIMDEADITIRNLSVDVGTAIPEGLNAIFSLGNATIEAQRLNVAIPETSGIVGIYIGATTLPENISITNSNPGTISISPDNDHDTDIIEKIEGDKPNDESPIQLVSKYDAATPDEFFSNLESYGHVRLTTDLSLTADNVPSDMIVTGTSGTQLFELDKSYLIDLNGNKLSSDLLFRLPEGPENTIEPNTPSYEVVIKNGSLDISKPSATSSNWDLGAIQIFDNSALRLESVTYESNVTGMVTNGGSNNISIDIIESNIDVGGYYCISTNASVSSGGVSQNIKINIEDSSLNSSNTWSSMGILFNIPGELTISDTTITALSQVIIARGGTHSYSNSTFISTGENQFDATNSDFSTKDWGQGNYVPLAALVIGNRGASYPYPTDMTLNNVTIEAPVQSIHSDPLKYHGVFIWQNDTTNTVTVRGNLIESNESLAEPFINTDMNGADISELTIQSK